MFRFGRESSTEENTTVNKATRRKNVGIVLGGAAAVVATSFPLGYFWADKDATDDRLKSQLEMLAEQDGFEAPTFVTGDVYGTYITMQIGDCGLRANVEVVRGTNGTPTELNEWVVSGYANDGQLEEVTGSDVTTPETLTFEGQNYSEVHADVQATAPGSTLCQVIRSIDPHNLEVRVG